MRTIAVVPSYNCPEALENCLSRLEQEDSLDGAVVINDATPLPEHGVVAERYCTANGWTLITNTVNMKAPYTIKQGIAASGADPDDIIFLLDGDDFLVPGAPNYIKQVYFEHPQLWLTYGSYQPYPNWTTEPHPSEYPTLVRWGRDFRNDVCRFNHPITFRRFLFDALADTDLQQDNGQWFQDGYDQVIMMPMLEMAGPDHYAFLTEILYYYNAENPLSESKLIAQKEMFPHSEQVRSRPKKAQLIRP